MSQHTTTARQRQKARKQGRPTPTTPRLASHLRLRQRAHQELRRRGIIEARKAQLSAYAERVSEMRSTITAKVVLPQYSRWTSTDHKRFFIVLDAWHGQRPTLKLLDVNKEEEIWRDTAEILALVEEGALLRF